MQRTFIRVKHQFPTKLVNDKRLVSKKNGRLLAPTVQNIFICENYVFGEVFCWRRINVGISNSSSLRFVTPRLRAICCARASSGG